MGKEGFNLYKKATKMLQNRNDDSKTLGRLIEGLAEGKRVEDNSEVHKQDERQSYTQSEI